MTVDQAVDELHELGLADALLTGVETPLPDGETRLRYSSAHLFDQPILVRSPDGEVRTEPWMWLLDKD